MDDSSFFAEFRVVFVFLNALSAVSSFDFMPAFERGLDGVFSL